MLHLKILFISWNFLRFKEGIVNLKKAIDLSDNNSQRLESLTEKIKIAQQFIANECYKQQESYHFYQILSKFEWDYLIIYFFNSGSNNL